MPRKVGGAVCSEESCSPRLSNCIINKNKADSSGGGIYSDSSFPEIVNCTIAENVSSYGGGIYNRDSDPWLLNCILWGKR